MLSIAKISVFAMILAIVSVDSIVDAQAASFKDPIRSSRLLEVASASGSQGFTSATASTAASAASSTASSSESTTSTTTSDVASASGSSSALGEGSSGSGVASTSSSMDSSETSSASSSETSSTSGAPASTSASLPAAQDGSQDLPPMPPLDGSQDLPPMPPQDGGMPSFDHKPDQDHRHHGRGPKPPVSSHMRREGSARDDFAAGSLHGPFRHHHRKNATEDVGSSMDEIGAEFEGRGNRSHPAWQFQRGGHHNHHGHRNGTNGTHVEPQDTVPLDNATAISNEGSNGDAEGNDDVLPQ